MVRKTAAKHIYLLLTSVKISPEPHGFSRKLRHLSRLFKKKREKDRQSGKYGSHVETA